MSEDIVSAMPETNNGRESFLNVSNLGINNLLKVTKPILKKGQMFDDPYYGW